MEDNEAVIETVVGFDAGGNLRPACCVDGGGVEELWELVQGIADVAGVL